MKNYIVTFTNDAIKYDMERQQEAIKQDLNGDDNYFSKINEEISFEQIDREVESALRNNFDNFICLAEDEDVQMLQNGLSEEYGNQFNEILVVPEAFSRLFEGDLANMNSNNNYYTLFNNFINEKNISLITDAKTGISQVQNSQHNINNGNIIETIHKELNISQNFSLYLLLTYLQLTQQNKVNRVSIRLGNTSFTISLNDKSNAAFKNTLTGNPPPAFSSNSTQGFYAIKSVNNKNTSIFISAKSIKVVSNATSIGIILFNLNYPFLDLLTPLLQKIKIITNTIKADPNKEVLFMICGPIPNQQFLLGKNLLNIAETIPEPSKSLDKLVKEIIPNDFSIHCGVPTAENISRALITNLEKMAPNCQEITIYGPESLSGTENQLVSQLNQRFKVQFDTNNKLVPDFDVQRNQIVYQALEDLVINKNNKYEKCKSTLSKELAEDAIKDEQELIDKIQGENARDVQKTQKDLQKTTQNSELMKEIASGWVPFVKSLIEATIKYKENPTEQNLSKEDYDKEKSEFFKAVIEPFKKDLESFNAAFNATGFGVIAGWLWKTGKALAKSAGKGKNPQQEKDFEETKNLILSDSYAIIKQQFGGIFDKDKIKDDFRNLQQLSGYEKIMSAKADLAENYTDNKEM